MNIRDEGLWPTEEVVFNRGTFRSMVTRRRKTLQGFMNLEAQKGIAKYGMSISSSAGQDVARLFMFRTLEELVESYDSDETDHRLEELIDALNYLWSIALFDTSLIKTEDFGDVLYNICARFWNYQADEVLFTDPGPGGRTPEQHALFRYTPQEIILHATLTLGMVTTTFRNRSWMNNAQDVYFTGRQSLIEAVKTITLMTLGQFESFDQFARFWIAKDNVLQFRLRTAY